MSILAQGPIDQVTKHVISAGMGKNGEDSAEKKHSLDYRRPLTFCLTANQRRSVFKVKRGHSTDEQVIIVMHRGHERDGTRMSRVASPRKRGRMMVVKREEAFLRSPIVAICVPRNI